MTTPSTFSHFANQALLTEMLRLAADERRAAGRLIAALAEVDARKLYLGEGCSSLFAYCTRVLHLSEHAAYPRIEAARAARRFPRVLDVLIAGEVTLTAVTLLAPHLTDENWDTALNAARHRSKREVEAQVAALRPLPPVGPSIRKVSQPKPARVSIVPALLQSTEPQLTEPAATAATASPVKPSVVKPLAPDRYKIQFTVSRETHDKLRRAQELLRHSIPDGDPAKIFERALTLLLADVERKKLAAATKPRDDEPRHARTGRHIPARVKRAVWKRDGGRCAFIGHAGRCEERGFLEFHHRQPFAAGGAATAENLELRCRAHNAYEPELFFGPFLTRETREYYPAPRTRSGPS